MRAPTDRARGAATTARAFLAAPRRRTAVGLALATAALLSAYALCGGEGLAVSYLPAWLCLLALPAGALPVVIMIERADAWRPQPETALLETLRGLLALMPAAALLAVPVLPALPDLPGAAAGAGPAGAFARAWYAAPAVAVRLALAFAAWVWLARRFARRGGEPWGKAGRMDDGRAVLGLGLHGTIGAVVADDLVMAIARPYHSSLAPLVLMASWSSLALSAAILVSPPDVGPARRRLDRLTPLAVLLATWACLHAMQALDAFVVPRPAAQAWYAARLAGGGAALVGAAGAVVLLGAILLKRAGENRTRLAAACALVLHGFEQAWFVTPTPRTSFEVAPSDVLALVGVAGLALALVPQVRRLLPDPDATRGAAR